jgi:hypothetical protein
MTTEGQAVILVYSTYHAMKIERVLGQENIPCRLVPVPRQLSSDCGVCVRIHRSDTEVALAAVARAGVEIHSLREI